MKQHLYENSTQNGECWLWDGFTTRGGYGRVKYKSQVWETHRLSYTLHKGDIPDGLFVLHDPVLCNNPQCVNPSHLRVGTPSDNIDDRRVAGNNVSHRRKLSQEDAVIIRESLETNQVLSLRYGVSITAINQIKHRITYDDTRH